MIFKRKMNIIFIMSRSLKLEIRNTRSEGTSLSKRKNQPLSPLIKQSSVPVGLDLSDKLTQLESNIRMLQKRYRSNLKEGFDNKIKAYRLQAVVERKILKQAIEQTQKANEREHVFSKIQLNDRQRRLKQSRASISILQRQQQEKFMKMRHHDYKKKIALSLHQQNQSLNKQARQVHDRIVYEQSKIGKKRDYFDFLKRSSLKKQEFTQKNQLLNHIISNTQKLKQLKYTLEDIRSGHEDTFLTI